MHDEKQVTSSCMLVITHRSMHSYTTNGRKQYFRQRADTDMLLTAW